MLLAGLGAGAVGAAAAAAPILGLRFVGGPGQTASWWDRTYLSLKGAGLAEWSAVVGETFALEGLNSSQMLKVVAVTAFPRSGKRPASLARSQAFSVVFETLARNPLPATDSVYQLTHRAYPPLPIYMGAPVKLAQKTRLIAVFN